jgi:hypothetical protein
MLMLRHSRVCSSMIDTTLIGTQSTGRRNAHSDREWSCSRSSSLSRFASSAFNSTELTLFCVLLLGGWFAENHSSGSVVNPPFSVDRADA